jgi:GntR family transcriptional regulator/MocR family aminotransferase
MHLVALLPTGLNDVAIAAAARKAGIALRALSPMCSNELQLSGLMLGFGGFSAEQLKSGVLKLRLVLDTL